MQLEVLCESSKRNIGFINNPNTSPETGPSRGECCELEISVSLISNLPLFTRKTYLFVVLNYGGYTYLGGRDFHLHGIRSKKGLRKKYLLGMVPNCIGITVVCCMRHNT